jgi:hypothetical protein
MRFMSSLLVLLALVLALIWIERTGCQRYVLAKRSWTGASYFICEENFDPSLGEKQAGNSERGF